MTEDEAFKELAIQNLAGFGWTVTAEDLPDLESMQAVLNRLVEWWNGLTQDTRDIVGDFDLADGFWTKGWLYEWPASYHLLKGNPMGRMSNTLFDIRASLRNAHERAADYAAQHAITPMANDPAFQTGQAQ